jgi:hypothetical protein
MFSGAARIGASGATFLLQALIGAEPCISHGCFAKPGITG